MNLSMLFVRPYNNRFDWGGLLIIFGIEVGTLALLAMVKEITKRKSGREIKARYLRVLDIIIIAIYIMLVLSQTWFLSSRNNVSRMNFKLFWSYKTALTWSGGLKIPNSRILEEICLNILMFIPLGYILPEVFKCFAEKLWKVISAGCLLSVIIEVGQYILHVGLCELDDVFNNTLGCFMGLLIWGIIRRVCGRIMHRQELN